MMSCHIDFQDGGRRSTILLPVSDHMTSLSSEGLRPYNRDGNRHVILHRVAEFRPNRTAPVGNMTSCRF